MTLHGYPLTREATERFTDRISYLEHKLDRTPKPQLCQVMEAAAAQGRASDISDVEPWHGFPWLTLVLGSGCLELPDDPRFTPEAIGEAVRVRVAELLGEEDDADNDEELQSVQAKTFAAELVRDRCNVLPVAAPTNAGPGNDPKPLDETTARMVLLAALLTQLYFRVKGAYGTPLNRSEDDRAVYTESDPRPSASRFVESVVPRCLEQIRVLQRSLRGGTTSDAELGTAISTLLGDVANGLNEFRAPVLRLSHLRLVTESAWYLLTYETSMYPGWSDLLLGLMLREGREENYDFHRSKPRFWNLRLMPAKVQSLYESQTVASWNTWSGGGASSPSTNGPAGVPATDRNRLFARAADVLWAQADILRRDGRNSKFPPASAFVTSFDIELEMALWSRAHAGGGAGGSGMPFYVVLPAHVLRHRTDDEAALVWLRGEVRPDGALDPESALQRLRNPQNWQVLSGSFDARELLTGPHVVHLSGCPLFELPTSGSGAPLEGLAADLRHMGVNVEASSMRLQHAVTVDEYLAFRQSETEKFWSVHQPPSGPDGGRRGLPPFLLGSAAHPKDLGQNPRFWMALGVPVSDAAVRSRIVSQITLRQFLSMADTQSVEGGRLGEPSSHASPNRPAWQAVDGVVVNRRMNEDEANILYWIGLDIVRDDSRNFVQDLEHYTLHLKAHDPIRPDLLEPCELSEVRR